MNEKAKKENAKPIKVKPEHYISGPQFMSDISEYYKYDALKDELNPEDNSLDARKIRRNAKKYFEKCGMAIYMMISGLAKNPKFSRIYMEGRNGSRCFSKVY